LEVIYIICKSSVFIIKSLRTNEKSFANHKLCTNGLLVLHY